MVIPHKIRLLRNHSIILGELRVRTRRHQSLLGAPLGNFPWWPVHGINLVFTTNAKYMPVHETQCNIARRVVHSTQVEWRRRCLESLNVWYRWHLAIGGKRTSGGTGTEKGCHARPWLPQGRRKKKPSGLESMPSVSTAYGAGGQPSISASRIIIRLALSAPASIGIDA